MALPVRWWLPFAVVLVITACTNTASISPLVDGSLQASINEQKPITTLLHRLDPKCRSGSAKLYDECGDQVRLFAKALARAKAEKKVLLVSFGAEWCIWCHVFAHYIEGRTTKFTYTHARAQAPDAKETSVLYERPKGNYIAEATALNAFFAKSFVLVHIDAQFAPGGRKVLESTGAGRHYNQAVPFVFSVSNSGKYAAHMNSKRVEVRRDTLDWYRGYNRSKLLKELVGLHAKAQG